MNESLVAPPLLPVLPEIVLAVGAMALLMIGVFRGEGSSRVITWASVALIVVAALITAGLPA